ncbi:flavin reductase family protein [Shouchella lonarensis]|uniref:NADH-FMN oxidoreductase RutF, flavin reductase (DIM6/NTAB) family n=1 Tax=Shouchella lonarensis TaxID=1464122 RepID=A0A1G6P6E4_9BACI|nr:flavin reductase family protein [Shouchella lonarensis]SDC75066.1 NADH-FMN oxidoreductase RutF, flavin reductase (DIM6/NTAB) family [Shouchella lonarensis]
MDDRLFKTAMSKFATGVTVLLTEVEGNYHGMTANAFMSVSLTPKLIAVSIANHAKFKPMVEETGTFSVNILSEDRADLSMHFAGQKESENVSFSFLNGLPVVEGAIATIACDVHDVSVQGDHSIFIGKVRDVVVTNESPLVYYEGGYKRMV